MRIEATVCDEAERALDSRTGCYGVCVSIPKRADFIAATQYVAKVVCIMHQSLVELVESGRRPF